MASRSFGLSASERRSEMEVDVFKSKAPEKDQNAATNVAEVVGRTVQQQYSVVEQPPPRRVRMRCHALVLAPESAERRFSRGRYFSSVIVDRRELSIRRIVTAS